MTPTVTHFFRITTQDSGIPRDPSQIAAFIRDQFRAAGQTSPAHEREQMFSRIRGFICCEKDARK